MAGLFFDSGIDDGFSKDLEKMNQQLNSFANDVEEDNKRIGKSFEKSTKVTAQSLEDFRKKVDPLGDNYNQFTKDLERNNKKIGTSMQQTSNSAIRSLSGFQKTVKDIRNQILTYVGITAIINGLINVFKNAFNTIKDFATGISELKALTGLAGSDLDKLKQKAKDLSVTYGKSAREIVDAMKLVGSARPELLNNADALGNMTDKVLLLSRASGLDLEKSTAALTGSLNQFNAPAEKAGEYLDILASAAQKGSKEIPFLSDFVLRTGKIAKDANLSFKDLITTAELLGPSFNSPEVAATGLNRVLLNLQKAGIGFSTGTFDMAEALTTVQAKLDGMTSESKKAAYQNEIFGDGLTVGKILLEKNGEEFDAFAASIGEAGSALAQASERMNNLQGDIDKASSEWDAFVLSLDEGNGVFSQIARKVTQTGGGLIKMLRVVNTEYANVAEKGVEMNKAASETIPLWDTQMSTLEFLIPQLKDLRIETERIAALRAKRITQVSRKEGQEILSLLIAGKELTQEELKQLDLFIKRLEAAKELNKVQKAQLSLAKRIVAENQKTKTPTKDPKKGKGNDIVSYYELLKIALKDAEEGLLSLSGKVEEIDQAQVEQQQAIITNLQSQIDEQEKLLGLKKETTKETTKEKKAQEGSIAFLEEQIAKAEENLKLATTEELRASLEDEIVFYKEQLKLMKGISSEKEKQIKKEKETIFTLIRKRQQLIQEKTEVDKLSDKYEKLNIDQAETEKKITDLTGQWITDLAGALGQVSSSISKVNEDLAKSLETISSILTDAGNILQGLASGNYLQAAVSAVNLAVKVIDKLNDRKGAEEEVAELIEIQNQALERQLKLLDESRGVAVYTNLRKTILQVDAAIRDLNSEMDKLQETTEAVAENRGIAELHALSEQNAAGGVEQVTKAFQDLQSQQEELIKQRASLLDKFYKTFTGTTSDAIADSILNGLKVGKRGVEDFAEDFESIMRTAAAESFSIRFLETQFDQFFEKLGKAAESEGEFTEKELNDLQRDFNTQVENVSQGYDTMKTFLDKFFQTTTEADIETPAVEVEQIEAKSKAGAIQQAITEETGSELVGRLGGILLTNQQLVNNSNDLVDFAIQKLAYLGRIAQNSDYLPLIEENTRRMNEKL